MTDADAAPCSVGVVVVAAGSGTRLGREVPKAFVHLAGRPLLAHALDTVAALPDLCSVVVVVPRHLSEGLGAPETGEAPPVGSDAVRGPGGVGAPVRWAGRSGSLWDGVDLPRGAVVVPGGAERTDSVAAGLAALDPGVDVVLVHDAARCLTPLSVFERVVDAVCSGGAGAVPGVPLVDTVKSVDAAGRITGTLDRAGLRAVQTPQGFRREVLLTAYGSGVQATDDAALVEAMGQPVVVVEGHADAFKVTTADDLVRAERLLASR